MTTENARLTAGSIALTLRTIAQFLPDPKIQAGLYIGQLVVDKGLPYVVDLIAALRAGLTDDELNALVDARKSKAYTAYDPNLAADVAASHPPEVLPPGPAPLP